MKELSIEEKAKRYDEALERARQFSEKPYLEDSKGIVDYIFPELKESEDERMMNQLHSWMKEFGGAEEYTEKVYQWIKGLLEKQGEQKPIDLAVIMKDYFANTPKEQQEKDWAELKHLNNIGFDIEIPFGAKDSELQEASHHIPEGFHAEIEGNRVVIKRGEQILANSAKTCKDEQKPDNKVDQHSLPVSDDSSLPTFDESIYHPCTEKVYEQKSSEWSEEDKAILNNIIWGVHMKSIKPLDEMDDRSKYKKYEDFLKSLPTRFSLHPKQEWSEEDEYHKRQILRILKDNGCSQTLQEKTEKWIEERLKSLKDRVLSQWKPSEEQMSALSKAIAFVFDSNSDVKHSLESLYNELKKL